MNWSDIYLYIGLVIVVWALWDNDDFFIFLARHEYSPFIMLPLAIASIAVVVVCWLPITAYGFYKYCKQPGMRFPWQK